MRDPPHNSNTVMQLNMGEGKSSVIVPIVAMSLADGKQLARVIVAKPQSRQMFDILRSRVGGLVDRRIYTLPFSRTTRMTASDATVIWRRCKDCMDNGGILLMQPESVLSLHLMLIDSSFREESELAKQLVRIRKLFRQNVRDIVDESDMHFSPKFELVYTIGQQRSIDLAPRRWKIVQEVLGLVIEVCCLLKKQRPDAIEMGPVGEGRFPRTRLVDGSVGWRFEEALARRICETGVSNLHTARHPLEICDLIEKYITQKSPSEDVRSAIEDSVFWEETTRCTLLLLRGLLAEHTLAFALAQKRWRVNYGLDHTRQPPTRLCVPYNAKDSPTPRSDYCHPDLVIILTCLSYYYGGLSDNDLFLTLRHLRKGDSAAEHYRDWTSASQSVPVAFHVLDGVNITDEEQCRSHLFPHLRYVKKCIDYFLSHIVFPQELKESPHKVPSSGWDIGEDKTLPMTGFSGTDDSRHLLPLTVGHFDADDQMHTNASVLETLLKPTNSIMHMRDDGKRSGSFGQNLIDIVSHMQPPTRVILDVGAQIIDMTNQEFARAWLDATSEDDSVEAVVYCDDHDTLSVLSRDGRVERLLTSPYSKRMGACLAFLDEAHTRGIDLSLPDDYRAIVTLGANMTKDKLVQACARMRKLEAKQTVCFCVPNEINLKIRALMPDSQTTALKVEDVLRWTMRETLDELARLMPVWAGQGRRFERQQLLWEDFDRSRRLHMSKKAAAEFLEDDALSLEQRYKPPRVMPSVSSRAACLDEYTDPITRRWQEFGAHDLYSTKLGEQEEREIEPEAEKEIEIARAPPAEPREHSLDPKVMNFIRSGRVQSSSDSFLPAFHSLAETTSATSATHFNVKDFPQDLYVTRDFAQTVRSVQGDGSMLDLFQRDVRWVLTVGKAGEVASAMVIISPFEAERLLYDIEDSRAVQLHLYAPRHTLDAVPIDHLDLYTTPARTPPVRVPHRLITGLNLFAGQLYFQSPGEYRGLCHYLCLSSTAMGPGSSLRLDGFIEPHRPYRTNREEGFSQSPVRFLQIFIGSVRRHGQSFERTHIGKVLDGIILGESDFGQE